MKYTVYPDFYCRECSAPCDLRIAIGKYNRVRLYADCDRCGITSHAFYRCFLHRSIEEMLQPFQLLTAHAAVKVEGKFRQLSLSTEDVWLVGDYAVSKDGCTCPRGKYVGGCKHQKALRLLLGAEL